MNKKKPKDYPYDKDFKTIMLVLKKYYKKLKYKF